MLYMKAAIFSNHVLIFLFLDPGKAPAFVYILFCFGFWFWNGSTGCLQRTVEEKSLWSVRQCRWRGAWLLNSALRRVWCPSSNRIFKMCLHLSLNWTWRLQAVAFSSSTLIFYFCLWLSMCDLDLVLNLRGYQCLIIWRNKKKKTYCFFYSDF